MTLAWLPVAIGLLALYVPSYYSLSNGYWTTESGTHGPIMLLLILWLFWRERAAWLADAKPWHPIVAACVGAAALALYYIGRTQAIDQLQMASQLPLLYALITLLLGLVGLKRLWVPIALLFFLIPVPGSILDSILLTLKEWVSDSVESLLYTFGYPIARSGVTLMIGPYRLLVANACAGLNSIIALSGIGLIYVYVAGHKSKLANGVLLASVIPIALVANLLRVTVLVLCYYYFGDAVGRAFHDYAGYAEIAFAFGSFFLIDLALKRYSPK